jgi:predicted double-glycine peptidase
MEKNEEANKNSNLNYWRNDTHSHFQDFRTSEENNEYLGTAENGIQAKY